jgi:hypothetical protein
MGAGPPGRSELRLPTHLAFLLTRGTEVMALGHQAIGQAHRRGDRRPRLDTMATPSALRAQGLISLWPNLLRCRRTEASKR